MARREYVVRRLAQMVVVLWAVLTLMFFLFRLTPSDPVAVLVGAELPAAAQAQLRRDWGLDAPLSLQYVRYLGNLVQGNLGWSFFYGRPVTSILAEPLRNTLVLMVPAALVALTISIPVGAVLGWWRGRLVERIGVTLPLAIRSLPDFLLGILLLMIFTYGLRWFPVGGMRSAQYQELSFLQLVVTPDFLRHLFLPFLCATLSLLPEPLLIMRTSTLESRGEDYLDLLKAKGHSSLGVLRHAARNSLLPVVSWASLMVSFAFGGQILIETVFGWPGIGREMVLAVSRLDYPVAQATFFLMAVVVIVVNFIVDLVYGYLDPRITYR
ncbi:MAG: ABC transporter permease [Candidatus Rokuibacteriota bacterium]